jgi:hypothetical protein
MVASRFASGSGHGRQTHSKDYGRETRGTRSRKAAASARVGPQGRLMDYLGSTSGMLMTSPWMDSVELRRSRRRGWTYGAACQR